jgi:solute carrier family 3 protein 2
MDGNKLELTVKPTSDLPASYKAIPEADMEEAAVTRPKSIVKSKPPTPEADGADEKMLPNEEAVVAKQSPNEKQNGDAKLDIGELKTAFVGLTKEELMKYANDPFWVRLRWFLFITFWILWGMMLLGAVMIILAAPKCSPPPPRTWWEKGPLAELEDTNPEQINKLKELGVTGVIIQWPEDAYTSFDQNHEFVKTIKHYKDPEVNVIVELEPGTSKIWFNESESQNSEFGDYYIWKQPKIVNNADGPQPPNNWVTVKNTSSWTYSESRKEFYYSPQGRPQLNFRNPNVTDEFAKVIKKFLGYGASGVRLRGAPYLLADGKFEDEIILQNAPGCFMTDYCSYSHSKTENLLELSTLLKEWRVVVKNMTENGPFMVADDLSNIEAYKVNNSFIVDLPLQSHLFHKSNANVTNIVQMLNSTFNINNITWPLWKINSTSEWDIITYLIPGTPLVTSTTVQNKQLLKMRESPSVMRGSFSFHAVKNNTVFAFIRVTAGNPGILVALNPSDNRTVVDFPANIKAVSEEVTVQLWSENYHEPDMIINVKQNAHSVPISPRSAIVLSYVPPSK